MIKSKSKQKWRNKSVEFVFCLISLIWSTRKKEKQLKKRALKCYKTIIRLKYAQMWKAKMEMMMIITNTDNCLCQRSLISKYKICNHWIIAIIIHFSLIRIEQKNVKKNTHTFTNVEWLIYLCLVFFYFRLHLSFTRNATHIRLHFHCREYIESGRSVSFHFICYETLCNVSHLYNTALGTM